MSPADPGGQERIEAFLRKSLLGDELVNTQFYLFSATSARSGLLAKPRVLCANNVLLAKSSTYFSDLLSSDINLSDPALSDLTDANAVPTDVQIDCYDYESDSDLDHVDDDKVPPTPPADTVSPEDQSTTTLPSPLQTSITGQSKDDDGLSEDGSESVSSDMFVMSPEYPSMDEPILINFGRTKPVASSDVAIQETRNSKTVANHVEPMRARSLVCRHVLVRDTAFQTWYSLLNYLYTGKINFLPLTSATPGRESRGCSVSSVDEPRCSAKSMYRLACKVGMEHLCNHALTHIRTNLTEHNILKELSCSLVSKYAQLLDLELDVLFAHIASPPVATEFSAFAQRIAKNEFPHGAAMIIGIHERLVKECRPISSTSPLLLPRPSQSASAGATLHPISFCGPSAQALGNAKDTTVDDPPSAFVAVSPPSFSVFGSSKRAVGEPSGAIANSSVFGFGAAAPSFGFGTSWAPAVQSLSDLIANEPVPADADRVGCNIECGNPTQPSESSALADNPECASVVSEEGGGLRSTSRRAGIAAKKKKKR